MILAAIATRDRIRIAERDRLLLRRRHEADVVALEEARYTRKVEQGVAQSVHLEYDDAIEFPAFERCQPSGWAPGGPAEHRLPVAASGLLPKHLAGARRASIHSLNKRLRSSLVSSRIQLKLVESGRRPR